MDKKKVEKLIKSVAATGAAFGGVGMVVDVDEVYALDEDAAEALKTSSDTLLGAGPVSETKTQTINGDGTVTTVVEKVYVEDPDSYITENVNGNTPGAVLISEDAKDTTAPMVLEAWD